MEPTRDVLDWLMEGDPSIRWQTMRDLMSLAEKCWASERDLVATTGWGARTMGFQDADGNWPVARWTGNVWTLILLIEMGFPAEDPRMTRAFESVAGKTLPLEGPFSSVSLQRKMDLCHLGFWLRIGAYFNPNDPRLPKLVETLLRLQMADGGWNCRIRTNPSVHHSSFHTTLNVLEGLREASQAGLIEAARFRDAEARAIEFMLCHRMYRSDHTGKVIDARFLDLAQPWNWRYRILRGMDYLRNCPEHLDPRLDDAKQYLLSRRLPDGTWPLERRIPGKHLFELEKQGGASRWNTLRALRSLGAKGHA